MDLPQAPGEIRLLRRIMDQNLRCDGRTRLQIRLPQLHAGVLAKAHGSAHVRLDHTTEVWVSIQGKIVAQRTGSMCLRLTCGPQVAQIYPWASPRVHPGKAQERFVAHLATSLAALYGASSTVKPPVGAPIVAFPPTEREFLEMEELPPPPFFVPLRDPQTVDYASLEVAPGVAWQLRVEIRITGGEGGNLPLAVSLGLKAALHNLRLPRVEQDVRRGVIQFIQEERRPWGNFAQGPLMSLFLASGTSYVVDPSPVEEALPHHAFWISTRPGKKLVGIQLLRLGTRISTPGPFPWTHLSALVREGPVVLEAVHQYFETFWQDAKTGLRD